MKRKVTTPARSGERRAKTFLRHTLFVFCFVALLSTAVTLAAKGLNASDWRNSSADNRRQTHSSVADSHLKPGRTAAASASSQEGGDISKDGLWQQADENAVAALRAAQGFEAEYLPRAFRAVRLDADKLDRILKSAPLESGFAPRVTSSASSEETLITLPVPDGTFLSFRIEESPIMEPELAAQFPEIKTYRGQGLDDPTATARFDWTPNGFHAIVLSAAGTTYIEPSVKGDRTNYLSYLHTDAQQESLSSCTVDGTDESALVHEAHKLEVSHATKLPNAIAAGSTLRTYRTAIGTTAEYTQTYGGGTVAGALNAVTTTLNFVNAIYERDLAVRMVLIANETVLLSTDTTTDGYSGGSLSPSTLVRENQTKLDAVIGDAAYDIGHVFDGGVEPGGGFSFGGTATIARVGVTAQKGRGASIFNSVQPSQVNSYYLVAHEMGHQFGAHHTFNATSPGCTQRIATNAYEPGTGSTIMGYRFNCAPEDLQSSDTYFHTASLEQILNYISTAPGAGGAGTPNGNAAPTVNAGASYTIPHNTPFALTAAGSDQNGDALTYAWEEFDLGTAGPSFADDGSRPLFRSFVPQTNPTRTFPRLSDLLNNTLTLGETMPVTTRTMNFRVTVRDNRANGGGVAISDTQVNVRADAGPFTLTYPNLSGTLGGNSAQVITWNVANTNAAPVGVQNVRILLSTDGGNTFPVTLAANTPNDGSETVTIPNIGTTSARVKVEAVGNIFFDISNQSFSIMQTATVSLVEFATAGTSIVEYNGIVPVAVSRGGDVSTPVTVEYSTNDDPRLFNCNPATAGVPGGAIAGVATARCDYASTVGTLHFAANERSKTISIPVSDDAHIEGAETFTISLRNPGGAALGTSSLITVTINDNDRAGQVNPIANNDFFVRQHYLDFFGRNPDDAEVANWVRVTQADCPVDMRATCYDRLWVSGKGFFESQEFQQKGYYVYRFYKLLGRANLPTYNQFIPNMVGMADTSEAQKNQFAQYFTTRADYQAVYPNSLSNQQFADKLAAQTGLSLNTAQIASDLNTGAKTRARVIRDVVENQSMYAREYNEAWVVMQYFGYLRRDGAASEYAAWKAVIDRDPSDFRTMTNGFVNSTEYKNRFGQP